jgi:hypothetical protein
MKLAASRPLRTRYGDAARELMVNKLSAKIIGEQIVQLYRKMVAAIGRAKQ